MAFNWSDYDCSFLLAILRKSDIYEKEKDSIEYNADDPYGLANKLNTICTEPNIEFVKKYRAVIEQELLKAFPDMIRKICKEHKIPGNTENLRQQNLFMKTMSKALAKSYINAIMEISGCETEFDEYSKFRNTIAIRMDTTEIPEVPLFDYQQTAVNILKKRFIDNDETSGILVMPTGSGKSRTAISFLIQEMIGRGYKILWLAHRHMLLDQAAENFYDFSGLAKIQNPNIKNYRINCISGEHLKCSQVGDSEVVVASIASVCRNKEHLKRIFHGKKMMIVVDECHHSIAPSYREVISFLRKKKTTGVKLLGLTATPIRANEHDSYALLKMFDDKVMYSISMSDLISKGILATPIFKTIETKQNYEGIISENEERLIKRYGELPPTLIRKIAMSRVRNDVIVKEYLDNKDEYGKTLIFAMDVMHCRLLCDELVEAGVKCDAIYNGNPRNDKIINAFKKGELDVLVNVNIMTEGTDVPDIQTVMLTRPTQSEGFLMQMIGRGMRGKAARGTETVNIIDFHDTWEVFNKWINPEFIYVGDDDEPQEVEYKKKEFVSYSWSTCIEAYKSLTKSVSKFFTMVALPSAWYDLIDEEGEPYTLILFENQVNGYNKMRRDGASWLFKPMSASTALEKYFSDVFNPPSEREIELFMYNFRNNEEAPNIRTFKDKKKVDPYYVSEMIREQDLDLEETAGHLFDEYPLAKDIYGDKETYISAVKKVYDADLSEEVLYGYKIDELKEDKLPWKIDCSHDLQKLYKEVVDEMFGGTYEGITSVDWTKVVLKRYFGCFNPSTCKISINKLLNSSAVDPEVIKYLIYHELLHRDYYRHDKKFRELEHLYPRYECYDYFLDSELYKYNVFAR